MPSRRLSLLLIWSLLVAIVISLHLGGYPLYDADEGRNGEVGREMAATNDYVLPHYDGLPYLDKPIVYFAAEAAVMEVLGPTETAARLPALLFTFLTALLLAWFARRVGSEDDGLVAAIAFLSMPLTIAFSRTVIFDSALTFFVVLAFIAFYLAVEEDKRWNLLAWTAIAVGVLTKGPVAIILPLFAAIPFALWRKRFRSIFSIAGLLLFVVVIAPWVWAVSRAIPDFLHYVVVTETAQRLATKALKRTGPPWYFIPYLIGGALPWSVVAIASWRDWKRREPVTVYLLLWVLVPFLFFSISQSKRPQYILPLLPGIALLIPRITKGFRAAAIVLLILAAALFAVPFVHLHMPPDSIGAAHIAAIALGIAALAGGLVALFSRRRELALIGLSLPMIVIPLAANPLLVAIGEQRSNRTFAGRIEPHLRPDTEIVGLEAFTGSMSFYLRRPITIVTPDAEELTSNYLIRHYALYADAAGSPIRTATWLRENAASTNRIYIVRNSDGANRSMLESRGLHVIAQGPHHLALGN